jgi:nucleoside diphosphate kinase
METPQFEKESTENLVNSSDVAVNPENGLAIIVIKPDAFSKRDQIIKKLEDAGLYIVKTVSKKLPDDFVIGTMYTDLPKSIEEETLRHFNSGQSEIILLKGGKNILQKIISVTGEDTNPEKCDEESIRYIFGEHFGRDLDDRKTYYRNAVHRAKDPQEQKEDLDKFEHWL